MNTHKPMDSYQIVWSGETEMVECAPNIPFNSDVFLEELKEILVECEPSCSLCYKLIIQLTQHIRGTHSPISNPVDVDGRDQVEKDSNGQLDTGPRRSSRKRKAIDTPGEKNVTELPESPDASVSIPQVSPRVLEENIVYVSDDVKAEAEEAEIEFNEDPLYTPEADQKSDDDVGGVSDNNPDFDCDQDLEDDGHSGSATFANRPRRQNISNQRGAKAYKRKNSKFDGEGKYKCEYCYSYFITNSALSTHTRLHEFPGQCGICGMTPKDKELTEHIMSSHKDVLEKPYTCMICEEKFGKAVELDEHFTKVHPSTLPYACKNCDKRFYSEGLLHSHSFVHTEETIYICEHCNKALKTPHNLEVHVRTHTKDKSYKCQIQTCDKSYNNKDQLQIHERSHMNMNQGIITSTTKDNQIACGICKRTFCNSGSLTSHLRIIHKDIFEQHECRFCGKKFPSKILRTKHILQSHPGEKPYECKICHKTFDEEHRMLVHVRTHTGEKPFQCNQCSDAFSDAKRLRSHMWVHTGHKPYKCDHDQCDKSFTTSHSLTVHKRIHSGEKPFMCEVCSKCFSGKKGLNQHMAFHKEDDRVQFKPHACEDCGKSFASTAGLNLHSKIHIGEKSHMCEECGKRFLLAHQLTAHLKTHNNSD